MQLILNNKEQIEAVKAYLVEKGFDVSAYDVEVKTVAGRGTSGARIEVELNDKAEIEVIEGEGNESLEPNVGEKVEPNEDVQEAPAVSGFLKTHEEEVNEDA